MNLREQAISYRKPEAVQLGSAVNAVQGDLGKPFWLFLDLRPIFPFTMTAGAYETDE